MADDWNILIWRHVWQFTLLIPVAILGVRWLCKKNSHFAYALLLLVMLKCLVPAVWASPTGLFCWLQRPVPTEQLRITPEKTEDSRTLAPTQLPTIQTVGSSSEPKISQTSTIQNIDAKFETAANWLRRWWGVIAFGIWTSGALALLGYLIGKQRQLRRFHLETQVMPSDELLECAEEVADELRLSRSPRIIVTLHPTVPFAIGLRDPWVVLPNHLVQKSSLDELKLVLAHEMTHLRRGDLVIAALQRIVKIVWWFHPFVWWLDTEIRRVREQCCDEEVVSRLNCLPSRYARCLLNMLEMQKQLRPTPELAGLSPLEVTTIRLENIMRGTKENPPPVKFVASALLILVMALVILPGGPLPASAPVHPEKKLATEPNVMSSKATHLKPIEVKQDIPTQPQPENRNRVATDPQTSTPTVSLDEGPLSLSYWITIETTGDTKQTFQANPQFQVQRAPSVMRLQGGHRNFPGPPPEFPYHGPTSSWFPSPFRPSANTAKVAEFVGNQLEVTSNEAELRLPLGLGTPAQLVFQRLPRRTFKTWSGREDRTLWTSQDPTDLAAFNLPNGQPALDAKFKASFIEHKREDTYIVTEVDFTVQSNATTDDQPLATVNLTGELTLSRPDHIPLEAIYRGRYITSADSVTVEIPFTVKITKQ